MELKQLAAVELIKLVVVVLHPLTGVKTVTFSVNVVLLFFPIVDVVDVVIDD